ncbi:MAG: biotin transporter BioY [Limnochordia bacterium]
MSQTPFERLEQVRELTRTALLASLTAVGAWLAFPLPLSPVPLTLQVVFMLMSGMLLGGRQGATSQILYLAMGALGLPVFSRGAGGLGVLLGPTGGYLAGFVPAAWICGTLAWQVHRITREGHLLRACGYAGAGLFGVAFLHAVGVTRLASVLHIGWGDAFVVGSLPFILPDALKAVLAASLVVGLEKRGVGQNLRWQGE